ncbi:hypothetical protein VSDG_00423 [Cytospora chrysosperma]|uniref:6-phosphogluconate dehydrogenase NADP-binding domain-containing protein n=1 Tax=Cytospora chrysosperma TaxID=252740 RepID=A0A423WQA7_CYTCH|nr:hypothetical protein VSDG_00423 [Valsa sordida]
MAPKLFYIGLGNMGRGMVRNIAEKGEFDGPLGIYNRSKQRAVDLSAKLAPGKTEVADSIEAGVSKADIIFTCLANDQAVTETVDAMVKADIKGKLIVDCSTIHPDTLEAVAKIITSKGAEFVACPVFGAPPMADAGALIPVPAGPKAAVDKIKPYLEGVTARAIIDLSDEPYHKAATLKLLGNTFVFNMIEQVAEGHVLAEKSGLGTQHTHKFIELMMPGVYAAYSSRMLSGDYWKREEPLFQVDLARKDAGHARKIAEASGVKLANLETADAHLAKVQEHTKNGDVAGIYGAVRKENGLKYENDA